MICNRCENDKPPDDFRISVAKGKSYRRTTCNTCLKAYWAYRAFKKSVAKAVEQAALEDRMVAAAKAELSLTRRARN